MPMAIINIKIYHTNIPPYYHKQVMMHTNNTIPIGDFVAKIISPCSTNGSAEYGSLNSKPSPLLLSSSFSQSGPKKRALLVGVTYKGKYKLKGTINDVRSMRDLLINYFDFRQDNILVLTEKESEPELTPAKKNIQNCMKWLVEDCRAGDFLVFYFSGHGVRQIDFDDTEIDGFNETICPADFVREGVISDDEIFSTIIKPLKNGVTLNAIVDSCHSGTILDLSVVYNREGKKWESNIKGTEDNPNGQAKECGFAISISACRDEQVAADIDPCIGNSTTHGGAMTKILVDIVKKNKGTTYGELLDRIQESIEEANQGCLPKRIIKRMCNNMLLQKPLLSASEPFEVYKKPFLSQ